ncbi:hypothetical protein ACWD26_41110 [Streptomyces sp. NPDC002787]
MKARQDDRPLLVTLGDDLEDQVRLGDSQALGAMADGIGLALNLDGRDDKADRPA